MTLAARSIHLMVRIQDSQSWHRGSIPLSTTKNRLFRAVFLFSTLSSFSRFAFLRLAIAHISEQVRAVKITQRNRPYCVIFNPSLSRDNAGLLADKGGINFLRLAKRLRRLQLEKVFAEVLAVGRQLMVLERGQQLLQLQEEAFAWGIAVGEHGEAS